MPVKVFCNSCGATLQAPDTARGKSFNCPKCSHSIAIPPGKKEELEIVEPEMSELEDMLGKIPPGVGLHTKSMPAGAKPPNAPPPGAPDGMPSGGMPMGGAPGPMNMPAGPMGGMPMGNPQFHRDTDEYPQGRDFKDEPERPTHIPPRVRVKTTRLEDVEDPTPWPASIYALIGSGIAVVWGILVLATVAALGIEAPREAPQQNVAQARPQNVRPQRQPVNSARPRPNRPANTAPPRASVNRPGANSGANSNDRPRDNGTNRNGSGVTPKNPKDSAAETYAEIEAAINEMGVDEFRHSGEFTTDRTDVDITVDGAAMILPMRTWETKSGDTYKAMLHGAPSVDNIPILTDDGQELDFTYEELSSRDHAYLNRFSFEIKQVVARVNALAASGIANASSGPKSAFAEMPKGAAMTPDVRVPFKLLKPVDAAIPEAYRDTSLQRMILSSDRSIAMLIVSRGRGIAQRFWLQLMNVRRGEQMGVFAMPTSAGTPFGITSDDKAVFTFTAPFGSKPAQFDKWTIEGSELVHAFDIPLIEEINNDRRRLSRDRDPDAIGMINDQTVFLIQDNALSLVDLETGQTQYRTEVANNDPPCFSANNRYLAIQPLEGTADGETRDVLIINCDNLELAGSFAAPVLKSLAFSDDGTRLAGLDDENVITVFDATTGEQVSMLPLADRAGSVYWSGDNFLVAINNNRHTIIDVAAGCPIGRWNAGAGIKPECMLPLGENNFLRAGTVGTEELLQSVKVPQPGWVAEQLDASQYYFQLGAQPIALDLSEASFDAAQQQQVEDSLKSAIADAGGEVAAGSPLRLVCRSKPGDPKSVKIKTTDRGTNTVICDTTICEIALYDGEDQLWRQEATFGGPTITTGSMQEFQQSIEDTSGPNVEFFTSAELPTRLLRENAWNELPTHKIER